jgi:hypothetical protein
MQDQFFRIPSRMCVIRCCWCSLFITAAVRGCGARETERQVLLCLILGVVWSVDSYSGAQLIGLFMIYQHTLAHVKKRREGEVEKMRTIQRKTEREYI